MQIKKEVAPGRMRPLRNMCVNVSKTISACFFYVHQKEGRYMQIDSIDDQFILDTISRHCPEALSAYLQCRNRADSDGRVSFSRDMIEIDMSEDFRTFRNNIKKLARENLLEWSPLDGGISVILAEDK